MTPEGPSLHELFFFRYHLAGQMSRHWKHPRWVAYGQWPYWYIVDLARKKHEKNMVVSVWKKAQFFFGSKSLRRCANLGPTRWLAGPTRWLAHLHGWGGGVGNWGWFLMGILMGTNGIQGLVNVPIFGDFGHHLQICVGDYIPNSWVVWNIWTFTNAGNVSE